MTRVSLFTGPVLIAVAVLAVLLAANFLLKQRAQAAPITDTLQVTTQGLIYNGKQLTISELSQRYRNDSSPRELQVVVSKDIPWGKTWELRDTLAEIAHRRPNIIIIGLD